MNKLKVNDDTMPMTTADMQQGDIAELTNGSIVIRPYQAKFDSNHVIKWMSLANGDYSFTTDMPVKRVIKSVTITREVKWTPKSVLRH